MPDTSVQPLDRHVRIVGIIAIVAICCGIVALASWQVGPQPDAADAGFPATPPPLALPSDTPSTSPLARAAAQLAAGHLEAARQGFIDVVAEDQTGVPGQVGLVLSRWKSTGAVSVERDLRQLIAEYPDSAFAALHLGMVQLLIDRGPAARATLRSAIELGHTAADDDSLRMATLADDLLHPDGFAGPLPVLVQPQEATRGNRAALVAMLHAVGAHDVIATRKVAARLARSDDPMSRIAAIAATFDKAAPGTTTRQLAAVAATTTVPFAARDRAVLLEALAQLWGGGARPEGCRALKVSTGATIDRATRRLAVPIFRELCAKV